MVVYIEDLDHPFLMIAANDRHERFFLAILISDHHLNFLYDPNDVWLTLGKANM